MVPCKKAVKNLTEDSWERRGHPGGRIGREGQAPRWEAGKSWPRRLGETRESPGILQPVGWALDHLLNIKRAGHSKLEEIPGRRLGSEII